MFAIPTYLFVTTVVVMLIVGFSECVAGKCPTAVSATANIEPEVSAAGLFLILRAFASGSTALTGVEAIANGVQAFREPKSRNAAATLGAMGAISISMFLGISTLARWFNVHISEDTINHYGTVISQIGRAVFNGGLGFYALQVFTAAILVLAANTAYQDFPRLSAILAKHRLTPRQYQNRGDRLVFSNGIITLAFAASLLLIMFRADVTRLIQLYVVGVFTAFTLSQAGMVRHWLGTRESGWRRSVAINSVGAVTTGVVLVVVASVKFARGAWIVILFVPILVSIMLATRRHYLGVGVQLRQVPDEPVLQVGRTIVLVSHHDEATDRALSFARLLNSESLVCVHAEEAYSDDLLYTWDAAHPDHPLEVLKGESAPVPRRVVDRIRQERDDHPESLVTVVLADRVRSRSPRTVLAHRQSLFIRSRLLFERRVVVTDLNVLRRSRHSRISPVPVGHVEQVVLVADLTRPVRRALSYAEQLGPPVTAVHIAIDEVQRQRLEEQWAGAGFDFPLVTLESPYRAIAEPLVMYLRERRRTAVPGTLINAIVPEFVVPGRITQLLHNQTGLSIKGALAGEFGIAVTSVPYHLRSSADRRIREAARSGSIKP
jgi:hypothetical protein